MHYLYSILAFLGLAICVGGVLAIIIFGAKDKNKHEAKNQNVGAGFLIVLAVVLFFTGKHLWNANGNTTVVNAAPITMSSDPGTYAKQIVHKYFGTVNSFDKNDSIINLNFEKSTGDLSIDVFGQDNLSSNMIRRGMWLDTQRILKDLSSHSEFRIISFKIELPLQDKFGAKSNGSVMTMDFSALTRSKINWDNFLTENIPKVADDYWEHPTLTGK